MISRTIERMRSASSWILNPSCLIDRFLDELEKLSVVLVMPTRRLACSEVHAEARLDDPFGV